MLAIKDFIKLTLERYKFEGVLGIIAFSFSVYLAYFIFICGWGEYSLRTRMFALVGVVGIIGLSLGIKRHEQSISEHRDERLFRAIRLLEATEYALIKGALHELEALHPSLNLSERELIKISLASYVLHPSQKDLVGDNALQIRRRNDRNRSEAFATLHKLCDKDSENSWEILEQANSGDLSGDVSYLRISGPLPVFQNSDFHNYSFSTRGITFHQVSFNACKFNWEKEEIKFTKCQIDGCRFFGGGWEEVDFSDCFYVSNKPTFLECPEISVPQRTQEEANEILELDN